MKKILFPTDFSEIAANALVYALEMADLIKAEINVIHVYHLPELKSVKMPATKKELYKSIEMEELDEFKKAVPKLREIAKENNMDHIKMSHMMIEGPPVPTIARIASKEEYDYVIMGTKGSTGLRELFMGSVTAGVIERVNRMIISVPEKASFDGKLDDIVFLTDYKDDEKAALIELIEFSEQFDARIHCLHFDVRVESSTEERMAYWSSALKDKYNKISFFTIACDDMEKKLEEYAIENNIDLVALLPRKKSKWIKIFSPSVSRQMANHLNIPLLTIPN